MSVDEHEQVRDEQESDPAPPDDEATRPSEDGDEVEAHGSWGGAG